MSDINYKKLIGSQVRSPYLAVKRFFDIVFSTIFIIVTSPLVLLFMVLIKVEDSGPVFYKQTRVGLMGKEFNVTKLRSMNVNAEDDNGVQWAEENDPRITRVGSVIRRTRIDELPQFFEVLKGDLSLIGPRPERDELIKQFCAEFPGFEQRLRIKPGISGYAQVNGGYDIDAGQKYKLDMEYIHKIGPIMDLKIFFKTIKIIFSGEGAR